MLFYIHVSTSFNNELRTDIVPWNSTVADLECGIKNHQQWDWLERDQDGEKFSPCLEKLQSVGRAYCTVCWMEIMYGTSGVYALKDHITGKPHKGQDSKHELLFARWNFLFCFMILSVLSTCNCDFGCCWSTIKNMTPPQKLHHTQSGYLWCLAYYWFWRVCVCSWFVILPSSSHIYIFVTSQCMTCWVWINMFRSTLYNCTITVNAAFDWRWFMIENDKKYGSHPVERSV